METLKKKKHINYINNKWSKKVKLKISGGLNGVND